MQVMTQSQLAGEAPAFVVIHTTSHEGGGLWNRDVSSPWLSWFGCEKLALH